jgi:hypothetical protein
MSIGKGFIRDCVQWWKWQHVVLARGVPIVSQGQGANAPIPELGL